MKYKLVMFDFDGTLADSFPWFVGVVNIVAERYKFRRVEDHEIETLRGYGPRQIVQHLGVPWWKLPLIGRHMRAMTADNIEQISLFAGVDQMLERLSAAGITIGLVTSNAYANASRILGSANAALITDYECDVSMFGKSARFRRVLKRHGVAPHEALCIGDELRDLEAAAKARIPFGAVAWGFTRIEALQAHSPAEVFLQMEDIAERIA